MTYYKPIWLLTAFSNIIETVMFNRLNQHLQANNVLAPEQFGFRTGVTSEKAIFTLTDKMLSAFNQWKQTGRIFCKLATAVYSVCHEILLGKLLSGGICGVNNQWF